MFLQFVPKTHLFFTAGKDRKIKQWDADKFELVQTLEVGLLSSSSALTLEVEKRVWVSVSSRIRAALKTFKKLPQTLWI